MKNKLTLLLILLAFLQVIPASSQDDKTVTLVVNGQGKTKDEAKQAALRNAIEQAFGTFISSKTEILNDALIKDEIVSVSNGNIQKFEVLSEIQIPDEGYATTLKATVSVSKLTTFAESKGVEVEFKGSLFAFNVNQQSLNEKNEIKAIRDLCKVVKTLADISFNNSIKVSDPIAVDASNQQWKIPMYISVYANNNIFNIAKYMHNSLKGISLTIDEANNYIKLGKNVYPLSFAASENEYSYILLRNSKSVAYLLSTLYYFNHSLLNFKISNGLTEWQISDQPKNLKYIYDYDFRLFIKKINDGSDYSAYCKASVFYTHCSPRFNCNVGKEKELTKVKDGNCYFNPGTNPIIDYTKWLTEEYPSGATTTGETVIDIGDFTTKFPVGNEKDIYGPIKYFVNQFAFVKSLKTSILNNQSGVVISFIGIDTQEELVRFYYDDIRSIEEINKITGYKILQIEK